TAVAEDVGTGGLQLVDHNPASHALLAQLLQRVLGHPLVVEGDQIRRHRHLLSGPCLAICAGRTAAAPTPRTAVLPYDTMADPGAATSVGRGSALQDATAERPGCELVPGGELQLAQHRGDVRLDRLDRDEQL